GGTLVLRVKGRCLGRDIVGLRISSAFAQRRLLRRREISRQGGRPWHGEGLLGSLGTSGRRGTRRHRLSRPQRRRGGRQRLLFLDGEGDRGGLRRWRGAVARQRSKGGGVPGGRRSRSHRQGPCGEVRGGAARAGALVLCWVPRRDQGWGTRLGRGTGTLGRRSRDNILFANWLCQGRL